MTLTEYGIHPLHDAAVAANSLMRAVRDLETLADSGEFQDVVGLATARGLAGLLADAIERQWYYVRPQLDSAGVSRGRPS